ncbi:MAG: hypothetical protein LBK58_07200 [Prevotellaceae bacterium]|jgi:hypothetical protein|nr:hypothetical protein [Prevotellaceae bacterium]
MIEKLHLALPGDPVSGSMTIKNLIMLHEHRDVIVKLDFPKNASFRLVCREEPFYSPVKKKQCTEFTFSAGEEVHIWLSKFHMRKIMIERLTSEGWNDHGFIDPRQDDGADYSPLAARPAPIILRFGLPNSPIGSTVKIPKAEATIPPEYLMELKRCHQSAADASSAGQSLLRLWETDKFPSLSREEGMRECHAYPQEPEYCCLVEIRPETELYRRLLYKESIVRLASPNDARLVADALVTTLGQVTDKAVLIRELRGLQPRFIIRTIGGVEKKIHCHSRVFRASPFSHRLGIRRCQCKGRHHNGRQNEHWATGRAGRERHSGYVSSRHNAQSADCRTASGYSPMACRGRP